jgi:4-hydroxy-3-methylbut-2-enyl diphosphate reductase
MKKIIIADHYGVCMGVKRAISIAEETACRFKDVTIFKEIVHNEAIVEKFRAEGVGQARSIDNVDSETVIIPAHGASPDVFQKAQKKSLRVIDATCPLVIRIHKIIKKLADSGYHILHFGDRRHDETIGIVGHAPDKVTVISSTEEIKKLAHHQGKIALTSQSTARVADFQAIEKEARRRFPQIEVFNTICNATTQRQEAITRLAPRVDLMLVVGSKSSANSNRLVKISKTMCRQAYLIDSADDIKPEWFDGNNRVEIVGLSAGASTPDFLIEGAIRKLKSLAEGSVQVVYPKKNSRRNELALKNWPI